MNNALFDFYVDVLSKIMEVIGIIIIVCGIIYYLIKYVFSLRKKENNPFKALREGIGKNILLGLEIFVAADIISTVIHKTELNSVFALAIIVVVRTFLSFSISTEIDGKLPWKNKESN